MTREPNHGRTTNAHDEGVAKVLPIKPMKGESPIESVAEKAIDEMTRNGWEHYQTAIQGPELWYLFFRRPMPFLKKACA